MSLFLIFISFSTFASEWFELAKDLDNSEPKVKFKALKELKEIENLETALKISVEKGIRVPIALNVIKTLRFKELIPFFIELQKRQSLENYYHVINSLVDKESFNLVHKMYMKLEKTHFDEITFQDGILEFFDKFNIQLPHESLEKFFDTTSVETKLKVVEYFFNFKTIYDPKEVINISHKILKTNNDVLKEKLLRQLINYPQIETRKTKIDFSLCMSDSNKVLKNLCITAANHFRYRTKIR